jgi:hypothetical protein
MTVEAGAASPRVGPAVDAAVKSQDGRHCLIVEALVAVIGMFAVTQSLSRPGSWLIEHSAVVSATAECGRPCEP